MVLAVPVWQFILLNRSGPNKHAPGRFETHRHRHYAAGGAAPGRLGEPTLENADLSRLSHGISPASCWPGSSRPMRGSQVVRRLRDGYFVVVGSPGLSAGAFGR